MIRAEQKHRRILSPFEQAEKWDRSLYESRDPKANNASHDDQTDIFVKRVIF